MLQVPIRPSLMHLCMFTSQEQVSPLSLIFEQNPIHLFLGILFKFTALEILLI